MILTKKRFIFVAVVLTVVLIISILFVMLWHGCFRSYDFRLNINSNDVYRIVSYQYGGAGGRDTTCRNEIQRVVRRLNSYRLTLLKLDEIIEMGETPRAAMTLFGEDGYRLWVLVMRGERQLQIAQTPVEYEGLRDLHRIRGLRGWFAPRAF